MAEEQKIGGYQCEFVDQVPEELVCRECKLVAKKLYTTDCCVERFCQVCIDPILKDKKPCPSCDEAEFTTFLIRGAQKKILALQVYCTMKKRGCEWVGQLEQLDAHLDTECQYVDVECPSKCDQKVQKCNLATHLEEDCPKREYRCPHCNFKATFEIVSNIHWPECSYYPVQCPNQCGVTDERETMEDHKLFCPLEEVECELSYAGCKEKFLRQDQDEHMERNTQKHLAMMATATMKISQEFDQKLQEKDQQIRELQEQVQQQLQEKDAEWKHEFKKRDDELKVKLDEQIRDTKQIVEDKDKQEQLKVMNNELTKKLQVKDKQLQEQLKVMNNELTKKLQVKDKQLQEQLKVRDNELTKKLQVKDKQITEVRDKLQQKLEEKDEYLQNEFKKRDKKRDDELKLKLEQMRAVEEKLQKELQERDQKHAAEVTALKKQLQKIEDTLHCITLKDVTMGNYKQMKTKNTYWYNEHFYTHPRGYKCHIYVRPNGYGEGRGTHVTVGLWAAPGEFDATLPWPAKATITLQLLNQHRDQDHVTVTKRFQWEKPVVSFHDVGYFSQTFIPHAELDWNARKQTQYLKNDCLRFKIEFE